MNSWPPETDIANVRHAVKVSVRENLVRIVFSALTNRIGFSQYVRYTEIPDGTYLATLMPRREVPENVEKQENLRVFVLRSSSGSVKTASHSDRLASSL
jgi:hypothetical protein